MGRQAIVLRLMLVTGLPALIGMVRLPVAVARTGRPSCDKIRAAVADGRTMDQIIAEFDTDEEHVTKCLQTRARGRKKTAKQRAGTKAKKTGEQITTPAAKAQARRTSEDKKTATDARRSRRPATHPFGPAAAP